MSHRRQTRIKIMTVGLLVSVLLLLISAVTWPDQGVRRTLFAIVLLTSVVLVLSFIVLVWARFEAQQGEIDSLRRDMNRFIGSHEADVELREMTTSWRQTVTPRERTA